MGVSNETRKDLLGYIRADVTTLYSQVEVIELWRSLDLLCSDGTSADILRFPAKSPQTGYDSGLSLSTFRKWNLS